MAKGAVNKKWIKIGRIAPVMVLNESSDARLRFMFRSRLGIVAAFYAFLMCFFAWHITYGQHVTFFIRFVVYMIAILFIYATIWNLTTFRSLDIDFIRRLVILHEKTLFSKKNRSYGFAQFKCITVGRHQGGTNYGILLEHKNGWVERLGWSEFGAMSLAKAIELVNMIAPKMGIDINAPTYFEEKPLREKRQA